MRESPTNEADITPRHMPQTWSKDTCCDADRSALPDTVHNGPACFVVFPMNGATNTPTAPIRQPSPHQPRWTSSRSLQPAGGRRPAPPHNAPSATFPLRAPIWTLSPTHLCESHQLS